MISVIIPTYGRPAYLRDSIVSIRKQDFPIPKYEIIVVDNKPDIEVRWIVQELERERQQSIFYVEEKNVGLHNARHAGAKVAQGEILVYVDDDTIATSGWLKAIRDAFNDLKITIVGGKILPKWEGDVPDWINLFKSEMEYGWTIGYLSLLDFGDVSKEIPAYYVYGCNFAIRKSVLFECGGFHPDSMPQESIRYRGDGETALSLAVMQKGYKTIYEPKAAVYHRVPTERLTIDYFCHRAFNQGISDSYTEIRRKHGLDNLLPGNSKKGSHLSKSLGKLPQLFMYWKTKLISEHHPVKRQVIKAYKEGKLFHRRQVMEDPKLLEYVLKDKYF